MAKAIDRIFTIIKSLGMSARQFDMSIGASNGYTLRMKKNNASVGSDILERIVEKYPFVNINWIITGRGNMFGIESEEKSARELSFDEVEAIIEAKIKANEKDDLEALIEKIRSEIDKTENNN
ncbi:hypothetical protein E7Z59_09850 [Robertkochia marina]|uniref:XRE family transcriptional regulator n=1 Tax=Robertkochia marina TaxID=1227945 RepID=A0A4S3M1N7_9FLAO|nr:hypothetical protein [Robertkochia marina]THD67943.1 hypothetical protein E7Z59_09850 [Robertkochia marina]TRZ41047.1 hypothetical protein D3A96_14395 [Robertkochia marina]